MEGKGRKVWSCEGTYALNFFFLSDYLGFFPKLRWVKSPQTLIIVGNGLPYNYFFLAHLLFIVTLVLNENIPFLKQFSFLIIIGFFLVKPEETFKT